MLGYLDDDLLVPAITALRYMGEGALDEQKVWRFEMYEAEPGQFPEKEVLVLKDSQLWQVLDLHGLLVRLQELTHFHPFQAVPPPSPPIALDASALNSLAPEITRLIADSSQESVTITIRFTDDGFSIGRSRLGGLAANFFTHPLLDRREEEKILDFFSGRGVRPHVDYLASKGRTRVLEFQLPNDGESIIQICRALLTEVFAMRSDDELSYFWHAVR